MAAAFGTGLAAALVATVLQKRYVERLSPWQATVGSTGKVHVTVYTESGSMIDTTRGKEPLVVTIGRQAGSLPDMPPSNQDNATLSENKEMQLPPRNLQLSKEGAKGVRRWVGDPVIMLIESY